MNPDQNSVNYKWNAVRTVPYRYSELVVSEYRKTESVRVKEHILSQNLFLHFFIGPHPAVTKNFQITACSSVPPSETGYEFSNRGSPDGLTLFSAAARERDREVSLARRSNYKRIIGGMSDFCTSNHESLLGTALYSASSFPFFCD